MRLALAVRRNGGE